MKGIKRSDAGEKAEEIIARATAKGNRALSEFDSKRFLSQFGISVSREAFVKTPEEAVKQAKKIGYPVALKACGAELTHKTDIGGVSLNLTNAREIRKEGERLLHLKGCEGLLVQEMVKGDRELVAGMTKDPRFGTCIMFGLGGTLTEVIKDVNFRMAPLTPRDAREMIEEIRSKKILGHFRGQPPVEMDSLVRVLMALSRIGVEYGDVLQIDINPLRFGLTGTPWLWMLWWSSRIRKIEGRLSLE